jgi:hypothetical protein
VLGEGTRTVVLYLRGQLVDAETGCVLRERVKQGRSDAAPADLWQDSGDEVEPVGQFGSIGDTASREVAVELSEEKQPLRLLASTVQLYGAGRTVRDHYAANMDPCLQVRVGLRRADPNHPERVSLPCRFA